MSRVSSPLVALQVNVDHVATLRQARGGKHPDPLSAALLCERLGVEGITVHLREDRRHIQDRDVERLKESLQCNLNLEMALTEEMAEIAARLRPDQVTLVPERRMERTTEGGLDVVGNEAAISALCKRLEGLGIRTSLFIEAHRAQVEAAIRSGARAVEFHTGSYSHAREPERELDKLREAADLAASALEVAAGHGLNQHNLSRLVAEVPQIRELNIGHALIGDAIFFGLEGAVRAYQAAIERGLRQR